MEYVEDFPLFVPEKPRKTARKPRARKPAPPRGFVIYEGASLLTGAPIVAIATLHSTNRKTGNMVQVWYLLADRDPIAGSRSGADRAICGDCPSRGMRPVPALRRRQREGQVNRHRGAWRR